MEEGEIAKNKYDRGPIPEDGQSEVPLDLAEANQQKVTKVTESVIPITCEQIWSDLEVLKNWLEKLFTVISEVNFDDIIKMEERPNPLSVHPIRLPYDAVYLFSHYLLAIESWRPETASITKEHFRSVFCESFLNFITESVNTANQVLLKNEVTEAASEKNVGKFFYWMVSEMCSITEGPEGKFLHYCNPDALAGHLTSKLEEASLLEESEVQSYKKLIPLCVSAFFAFDRNIIWTDFNDVLKKRQQESLEFPVQFVALFLRRWGRGEEGDISQKKEMIDEILDLSDPQLLESLGLNRERILKVFRIPL